MNALSSSRPTLLLLALLLATPVPAAPSAPSDKKTTIDLAAEASRPAANDLARATVFAEASGATPGELGKRVNALIADGLKTAKGYAGVRVQNAAMHTYPVYGKTNRIEGWRMRSDLTLESADTAALSELLGKLQANMGIASLSMLPAPETRKQAENEAMVDAVAAFKARAGVIAGTLGKPYRIRHLSINSSGRPVGPPLMRAAAPVAAEGALLPVEAGESVISISITGQIELTE